MLKQHCLALSLKCCTFLGHPNPPICHPSITAQPYHSRDRLSGPWRVLTYLLPSNIPAHWRMQKPAHTEARANGKTNSPCRSAFSTMDSSVAAVSCRVSLALFRTKDSARHSLHVCLCITRLLSCNFQWHVVFLKENKNRALCHQNNSCGAAFKAFLVI